MNRKRGRPKELLRITVFDDMDIPHEVKLLDTIIRTNQYNDIVEALRQTLQARLQRNYQTIMNVMTKKGALKNDSN